MSTPNSKPRVTLRLAEIGIDWPPETFIALKLTSLAGRGMEVRAASFLPEHASAAELEGVTLHRLPHWTDGPRRALPKLIGDLAALTISDPRRLTVLLETPRPRRRLLLHLARLDADVVHFEWLTVACTCLPVIAVWDRPVVVSCRG